MIAESRRRSTRDWLTGKHAMDLIGCNFHGLLKRALRGEIRTRTDHNDFVQFRREDVERIANRALTTVA